MSSRPPVRPQKRPTTEYGTAVSRYKQLMAAGGPQVLTTGSICGKDAAIFHVMWCLVLQTAVDRCTQLVLHPLWNVEPVQVVVEQIGESAIVLPRVGDDASSGIHNSLELVCGRLGCSHENSIAIVDA